MRVLIDCGAHNGDSLPALIKIFGPFDRIVCFEANPNITIEIPGGEEDHVEILYNAVWVENTELRFFFGERTQQSSLMENKTTGSLTEGNSVIVKAVDFSDWVENNTTEDDDITLKIDIEGAEFDVLEKLVKHSANKRIKRLFVEWHNNRLKPRWRYRIRRKILEIRYLVKGVKIRIWRRKDFPEIVGKLNRSG